jgi:hypothetical protein
MKEGETVKVYQDPVLCTRLEGTAELLQKLKNKQGRQEYWRVKFIEDNFITDRWINVDIH